MAKLEEDNYIGCIVGGAIGDALGAPVEFMKLPAILSKYGTSGVTDYVEFENGLGEITDDTQMLMFTAEGLLRSWHRAATKGIWGAYETICYQSYLRWLYTQHDGHPKSALQHFSLDGWLVKEKFLYKRRAPGTNLFECAETGYSRNNRSPH